MQLLFCFLLCSNAIYLASAQGEFPSIRNAGPFTTMCKDGWKEVYIEKYDSTAFRLIKVPRCVKEFSTPRAWTEAVEMCRREQSHLIMLDQKVYINSTSSTEYSFNFGRSGFWSGMHVLNGRLQWDGTPITAVPENTGPTSRQWTWGLESNEPNSVGECVSMRLHGILDLPDTPYSATMEKCSNAFPFVCIKDPVYMKLVNESYCPPGYYGNQKFSKCYKAFFGPVTNDYEDYVDGQPGGANEDLKTFVDAEQTCQAEGGTIARFNTAFDESVLALAYYTFSIAIPFGFERPVWMVNESGSDLNNNICYAYMPAYSPIRLLPGVRDCNVTKTAFICEKAKLKANYVEPTIKISYNYGTLEVFQNMPLTCEISRDLTENETLAIQKDGITLTSFTFSPDNVSNRKFSYTIPKAFSEGEGSGGGDTIFIPDYISRDAMGFVGSYNCRIYTNTSTKIYTSQDISIRFNESLMIIYKASIKLSVAPRQPALTQYNLYGSTEFRETSPVVTGLTDTFQNLRNSLSSTLSDQRSTVYLSIENIKFSPNGTIVTFTIFGRPSTTTWYTQEKEKLLKEEMIRLFLPTLQSLNEGQRRKREIIDLETVYIPDTFDVLSTAACSESIYDVNTETVLDFKTVRIGEYTVTDELCITDKNPLAGAFCQGDGFNEAKLTGVTINPLCKFKDIIGTYLTPTLKNLSEIIVTDSNINDIITETVNLTSPDKPLTSIDVIYTAEIIRNVAKEVSNITEEVLDDIIDIVNNILELKDTILEESQDRGSATNRILESIEEIAGRVLLSFPYKRIFKPSIAVEIWDITQISDPVIGIKLDSEDSILLQNGSLVTLTPQTGYNVADVDVAITLPESLYLTSNDSKRLVMQVHANSKLFNTREDDRNYTAKSRIIAAQLHIDGQVIHDLGDERVTTVFRPMNVSDKDAEKLSCGYWNYTINGNSGGWAKDGCELKRIESGRYICVCDHLTNFAILLDFERTPLPPEHKTALTVITIIGLSLSIAGLLFTVLTFIWFRQLRKGRAQQTLFNLALAMLCSWVVFLAGVERTESYAGCIAVAALLHYFILVSFMWMLIEGILQYLRFVKVLGTYIPRFMLKAVLPAWGIPLIPVVIILAVDRHLYWGDNGYCWMSLVAFYYAFAVPVGLVILANIVVFIIVLKNLLTRPKMQSNQSETKIAWMNFRAALSVFVVLGLTWIFGYLAIADARIVFQYIFTILNAFQGLFIFILFTAREKQVRQHWYKCCCRKEKVKSKYSAGQTNSSGSNQPLKTTRTGSTDNTFINSTSLIDSKR